MNQNLLPSAFQGGPISIHHRGRHTDANGYRFGDEGNLHVFENTLAALILPDYMVAGQQGVEFDVRISDSKGEAHLVLSHDPHLARQTNGTSRTPLAHMTRNHIHAINSDLPKGRQVAFLDDLLDSISPQALLVLEMKTNAFFLPTGHSKKPDLLLAHKTAKALAKQLGQDKTLANRLIVQSFDPYTLLILKKELAKRSVTDVRLALLTGISPEVPAYKIANPAYRILEMLFTNRTAKHRDFLVSACKDSLTRTARNLRDSNCAALIWTCETPEDRTKVLASNRIAICNPGAFRQP